MGSAGETAQGWKLNIARLGRLVMLLARSRMVYGDVGHRLGTREGRQRVRDVRWERRPMAGQIPTSAPSWIEHKSREAREVAWWRSAWQRIVAEEG